MNASRVPTRMGLAWLLVVAAVVWFGLLGYRDLADPDEGRGAEVAREIVATGDWVTMRLNGIDYFAKPPLQFWATAVTFELFGQSNATARLSLALFAFAGVLWTGFVGRRLFGPEAGFNAGAVLLSSLLYAALGHVLTPNMSVTLFMTLGIGAFVLAQSRREDSAHVRRWMVLGWAALALAVLSKGLMGVVLPGAVVFLYMLWQRDWGLLRHLEMGWGLVVFLAVAVPWFVAVSIGNPEFPRVFFVEEHFARYTTSAFRRDQPLYYFVPVLALGILPWLPRLVQALARPHFRWWPVAGRGFDPERFLWTYVVFVFLFFSLGRSKLPTYLLPILPALALLIGRRIAEARSLRPDLVATGVLGVVLLAGSVFVERFASESFTPPMLREYGPWIAAAGLSLLAGAAAAAVLRQRWQSVAAIALFALLGFQLAGWGYQTLQEPRSSAAEAAAIRPLLEPQTQVFSVGRYNSSLPFYLGRTVELVRYKPRRELDFAEEVYEHLPSVEDFRRDWEAMAGQAVAVFRTEDLDDPAFRGLPGRVVYQSPTRTALARR
jgi:4-amino-4-deoxy-L-arabinose transferase-like glycosyltransferase